MKKMKTGCGVLIGIGVLFTGLIVSALIYYDRTTYRENRAPLVIKPLPKKNPTLYTFDGNLDEVREKILKETSYQRSDEADKVFPFISPDNNYSKADYFVRTKDKAFSPELRALFEKPENEKDIFLENDGLGIISPTYYALEKPLRYLADFHIHLDAVGDNKTKVSITIVEPRVYKGYGGRGLHGALLPKQVPVEATTIEEYQLLRFIGFILGEKDMPEVILPK